MGTAAIVRAHRPSSSSGDSGVRVDRDLVEGYVVQGRQRLGGAQHPGRGQRRRHRGVVEHRLQGLALDQLHGEPGRLALVDGDDGRHGHRGRRERVDDAGLAQHVVPADRLLARRHRLDHQRARAGLDPVGQARVAAGHPREEAHLHVGPLRDAAHAATRSHSSRS